MNSIIMQMIFKIELQKFIKLYIDIILLIKNDNVVSNEKSSMIKFENIKIDLLKSKKTEKLILLVKIENMLIDEKNSRIMLKTLIIESP